MSTLNRTKYKELMSKGLIALLFVVFSVSCGTQQNVGGESPDNFEELKGLVNTGEYMIENQWALPLNGSMIDLIGNPNHIRVEADSVDIYLPYFGVRHSGGDYGGRDGGIKYEGPSENLTIKEDTGKERINIEFNVAKDNESYKFMITLFANGNVNTSVNSSARNSISYRGKIKSLPKSREEE